MSSISGCSCPDGKPLEKPANPGMGAAAVKGTAERVSFGREAGVADFAGFRAREGRDRGYCQPP